jgi:hypothetical protein
MRNPKFLNQYITKDDMTTIRKFTPVRETWENDYSLSASMIVGIRRARMSAVISSSLGIVIGVEMTVHTRVVNAFTLFFEATRLVT